MKKLIVIIFSLVLVCILAGCRTTKDLQNTSNVETRIEYRDKYHRDSIYIRDSVIIHEKGDTVYKDRWRIEWKDKIIRDTVFKTDTVYKEKEVFRDRSEPPNDWNLTILLIIIAILIFKFK